MDFSESTKVVYNRIQKLEPENVSKIIGFLLLQDHGEQEMIRLAFSPDNLIYSLINRAKSQLGLNKLPVSAPISASQVNHPLVLEVPGSFSPYSTTPSHPVSSPVLHKAASSYWDAQINGEQQQMHNFDFSRSGYAEPVAEGYLLENQMQFLNLDDQSEFVNASNSDFPTNYFYSEQAVGPRTSRRSPSLPEFPVKPCHYYSKGFCKHGSNCRYLHVHPLSENHFSPNANDTANEEHVLSPVSLEKLELELTELLKSRRGMPVSIASLPMMYYEKYGRTLQAEGYLTESQRHGKAGFSLTKLLARLSSITLIDRPHGQHSVVLAEDSAKYPEHTGERNDPGGIVAGSRQIYLTFPAESTFTEQDVSNYFSKFGPVQDVRIPCQQKRMFGFVTFGFVETVKQILAKGNPHFVCGARVLVKPYREKSKLMDRKQHTDKLQQQQMFYRPQFVDGESELHSISSNSRLFRKQLMEEHEHALEFERRHLSELQLTPKPPLEHQPYFGYSANGLRFSAAAEQSEYPSVHTEQAEFTSSERFHYLLDVLNNNEDKVRHISTHFNEQDSQSSLNLPESPFASTMGSGISTVI